MLSGSPRSRPKLFSASHSAYAAILFLLFACPMRALPAPDAVSPSASVVIPAPPSDGMPTAGPSPQGQDTLSVSGSDSATTQAAKSRTDSLIVVKHSFEHREQIITGSVIMSCLMLMMVAMNNYNPR